MRLLDALLMLLAASFCRAWFVERRVRIGVDYGPRLIGIAYSDYFGAVTPYTTIRNNGNLTYISEAISRLATSLRASEVILGVPLDTNGRLDYHVRNMNGKICLNFSFVLASVLTHLCRFGIKVRLFDERFTTQEAKIMQLNGRKRTTLDALAASCILERYLEDRGEGSVEALPCAFPPPESIAVFDYELIRRYVGMQYNADDLESLHELREYLDAYKVYSLSEAEERVIASSNELAREAGTDVLAEGSSQEIESANDNDNDNTLEESLAEMREQLAIRSQRRKKGTLRRPPPILSAKTRKPQSL